MLSHFWTDYGTIIEEIVQESERILRKVINEETHFEELFMKIENV